MKRPRHDDGVWAVGLPLPTGGDVCVPSPEKKIEFRSQIFDFWCILGAFPAQLAGLGLNAVMPMLLDFGKLNSFMYWMACYVYGKLWYNSMNGTVWFLENSGFAQSFEPANFIFYIFDGRRARGHGPPRPLNPPSVPCVPAENGCGLVILTQVGKMSAARTGCQRLKPVFQHSVMERDVTQRKSFHATKRDAHFR